MSIEHQHSPSAEQLVDVVGNCSVGITVTDDSGSVLLLNKAQSVLTGGELAHLGDRLSVTDSIGGFAGLLKRLRADQRLDNVRVTYRDSHGTDRAARVHAVQVDDGGTRIHWVSCPELHERLPVADTSTADESASDATSWIHAVDAQEQPARCPRTADENLLREFYTVAPVAIHLIGVDGNVMHANPADLSLVEFDSTPSRYVGRHIRQIYQDKGVIDDFLSRWNEDSPIINFRANFVTSEGRPKPVLIFSTAQADDGNVSNTRCFVFPDPQPERSRDEISAFGWPN